jgi:Fe2+ transport system protein FeoA
MLGKRHRTGRKTDIAASSHHGPGSTPIKAETLHDSLSLEGLEEGQEALVLRIDGDSKTAAKLGAMGLRPGTRIMKKSSSLARGPVVIERDRNLMAIGNSLARKVIVKLVPSSL